jgi:hypothetical protein
LAKLSQVSFSRGEIEPALAARTDLSIFATSLKTCRNFCVSATGGVYNRAGTEFIYALDASSLASLIPFVYSVDVSYMLVLQDSVVKPFSNGAYVQNVSAPATIIDVVLAGSGPYSRTMETSAPHGFVAGQYVTITGVIASGTYIVNGESLIVSIPDATHFTIESIDQNLGAYTSGGMATVPVEVATPYLSADLYSVRFTQSANVLTLVQQTYLPAEFTRLTANSFQFADITDFNNGPFLPENITATTVTASARTGVVTLTASTSIFTADHVGALFRIDIEDLSTIPPWEPSKLLAASGANPLGLFRRASGKVYECTTNEVASGLGTFTGTVRPIHEEGAEADGDGSVIASFAQRAGVQWTYRHSLFGVARITAQAGTTATATVLSYLPIVTPTTSTIWAFGAWSEDQGYPALVTYYQDRLVLANSPGQPQTEWASKVGEGNYHDFGKSSPLVSDDGITQTLNARQINAILELVPLDQLVALTASSSWASPKRGETWTPQTIGFDPQSYFGAADIRSVIIGEEAIFAERGAKRLRLLSYAYDVDKFKGGELTILARHLFKANTIVDMDYAADPHGVLWVVRSDGALCSLTYLKEQEVVGWARHDTAGGTFERVCVIPEAGRDAVYFIVRRAGGRYLERLANREFSDLLDANFVDSGLTYDGRNLTATTITISGSYVGGEACTLTASAAIFAANDVGDAILFDQCRVTITGYTSPTVVTGLLESPVPAGLQAIGTTAWTFARDTFTGLAHLNGESVAIFADGSALAEQTVVNATITLDSPAGVVRIGKPITAEIETLEVTVFGGDPIRDRAKCIPKVAIVVEDTVGGKVGPDAANLEPIVMRELEMYTDPIEMKSEVFTAHPATTWNKSGRVLIRQDQPLPMSLLAAFPQVELGGDG